MCLFCQIIGTFYVILSKNNSNKITGCLQTRFSNLIVSKIHTTENLQVPGFPLTLKLTSPWCPCLPHGWFKKFTDVAAMDDVDRLFECFKCGISPPRKIPLPLSSTHKLIHFSRIFVDHFWPNLDSGHDHWTEIYLIAYTLFRFDAKLATSYSKTDILGTENV